MESERVGGGKERRNIIAIPSQILADLRLIKLKNDDYIYFPFSILSLSLTFFRFLRLSTEPILLESQAKLALLMKDERTVHSILSFLFCKLCSNHAVSMKKRSEIIIIMDKFQFTFADK